MIRKRVSSPRVKKGDNVISPDNPAQESGRKSHLVVIDEGPLDGVLELLRDHPVLAPNMKAIRAAELSRIIGSQEFKDKLSGLAAAQNSGLYTQEELELMAADILGLLED